MAVKKSITSKQRAARRRNIKIAREMRKRSNKMRKKYGTVIPLSGSKPTRVSKKKPSARSFMPKKGTHAYKMRKKYGTVIPI